MFTGIITEIGTIKSIEKYGKGIKIKVNAPNSVKELAINDSISINGACQTVIKKNNSSFEVIAVEETLKKTTFKELKTGDFVNLELSMKLNDRLSGHIVQGHIDTIGKIKSIEKQTASWIFTVEIQKEFMKYIIPVGSIAIDGISLTVAEKGNGIVKVSIIPHTMENTIIKYKKVNDPVNLEFDFFGKYIENYVGQYLINNSTKKLTSEKLKKLGY